MAFCNQCGTKIPEDAAYCGHCGAPGTSPVYQPPAPAAVVFAQSLRRSPLRPVLWIGGALAVVVLIIVGLVITKAAEEGVREGVSKNVGHDEDIKSIRAVMRQDEELTKSLGREMKAMKFRNEESLDAVASLMQDYIDQAKQIDTKFCPRDFAEAYYRNLAAWSDEAETFRSHPHIQTGDEAFVNGFFRGLQGDASGGAGEIRAEVNEWQKNVTAKQSEIDRTWAEVQALAVRYGA